MEKSNDLNQLQSDFISTVSHELRTPLTSIRGFADTLITSHSQLSEEQQLKFLNIIKDQSQRLINLVENLLSASSSSVSQEIYVLKPTNILSSIEKTVSILKQKYLQKTFIIDITTGTPEILVDKDKLEQVLINIIENACKYSFENSDVKISAKILNENTVTILVENDGAEISPNDKDKIFQKFSRLDNPMTRLTQGTGIGLYIAKKITEKMNGTIDFKSENKHTIFTLAFPVATPENIVQSRLKGGTKND